MIFFIYLNRRIEQVIVDSWKSRVKTEATEDFCLSTTDCGSIVSLPVEANTACREKTELDDDSCLNLTVLHS